MLNGNHNSNGQHSNGPAHLTSNGHKPDTTAIPDGQDLHWDGLSPATTRSLAQPLDPALICQRKGRAGMVYHYLEGHAVIDQANRIFGFGGWGYDLVADVTLRRIESVDSRTGEVRASLGYSAPVRVTVAGAQSRTDIGFHAVTEDTQDGHDTAIKGAVTDGMKRALRSFGVQFGNGLYGDQAQPANSVAQQARDSRQAQVRNSGDEPPRNQDSQAQMLRNRIMELGAAQGFNEDQIREAVAARTGKEMDSLTPAELAPLVRAAANKLKQLQEAKAS